MNRESFLRELNEALAGRMPPLEIEEILADYREFFAAGIAEGNSEEQVAAQLGAPAKIALSLLSPQATARTAAAATVSASPADAELGLPKAEPYRRLLAIAVDLVAAALPFLWLSPKFAIMGFFTPQYIPGMLASFLSTVIGSSTPWIAVAHVAWSVAIVLSGVWFFALNPFLLIVSHGQTAGKHFFGLRVVNRDGAPAAAGQFLAREWLAKLGLNVLCGLIWAPLAYLPALLSLVWCVLSREGLTLWDAIAGTRVVDAGAIRREA